MIFMLNYTIFIQYNIQVLIIQYNTQVSQLAQYVSTTF